MKYDILLSSDEFSRLDAFHESIVSVALEKNYMVRTSKAKRVHRDGYDNQILNFKKIDFKQHVHEVKSSYYNLFGIPKLNTCKTKLRGK